MAEPHWTSYVGMVTGIVVAVSGISGAILGIISYRRTTKTKQLDLRLELRKSLNETASLTDGIDNFIRSVYQSHERVMAMHGLRNSGAWEIWDREYDDDKRVLHLLLAQAPAQDEDFSKLSAEDLEARLIRAHKFQGNVKKIREKYKAVLDEDDEQRKLQQQAMERPR